MAREVKQERVLFIAGEGAQGLPLHVLWQDAVPAPAPLVAEALADGSLERLARRTWPGGEAPSLRWIPVT